VRRAMLALAAVAIGLAAAGLRSTLGGRAPDPALAVDLAREGNRRFPDSEEAPVRASS
jgi:hypothetical protein